MKRIKDAFINTETLKKDREMLEKFYLSNVENLSFTNPEGYELTASRLIVDNPVESLVIIPGRGEIAHKFCELFYSLSKLKVAAVVIFARGQGSSTRVLPDRQKYHIEHFEDYAKDVTFVLDKLYIRDYNLLAFSLGGLISLDILKNQENKPKRVSLIAPYLWPYFNLKKPSLYFFISLLDALPFTRTMYTPHGSEYKKLEFEGNHHSHDPERFNYYHDYFEKHPVYTIGGPTFHFVKEAMKKQLELFKDKFEFTVPVFCQSAGDDKVVSTKEAQRFFEKHANDPVPPKFEVIENAYHDIINESDEFRIKSLTKALDFLFKN